MNWVEEKKSIRRLFIFFLIFLPFQYGMIGLVSLYHSEPWPAFISPGFKTVHQFDDNYYSTEEPFFYFYEERSDVPVELDALTLFSDIPRSQIQGFVRKNFSDLQSVEKFQDETVVWMKERAGKLYPGADFRYLKVDRVKSYYRLDSPGNEPDSTVILQSVNVSLK